MRVGRETRSAVIFLITSVLLLDKLEGKQDKVE